MSPIMRLQTVPSWQSASRRQPPTPWRHAFGAANARNVPSSSSTTAPANSLSVVLLSFPVGQLMPAAVEGAAAGMAASMALAMDAKAASAGLLAVMTKKLRPS